MHTTTITHCVTVDKGDHNYFPNFPPFQGVGDIELGQDDENEVTFRMRKFAIAGGGGHSFIVCVARPVEVIVEELWDISVGVLSSLLFSSLLLLAASYFPVQLTVWGYCKCRGMVRLSLTKTVLMHML